MLKVLGIGFVLLTVLVACTPAAPKVDKVEVSGPSNNALKIGEATQFTAIAREASGAEVKNKTFTWTSSDDNIASVAADGKVTAKRFGKVTISAAVDGKTGASSEQTTYGLEVVGGTFNRPFITPSPTIDPVSVGGFFRFRKADGSGPTSNVNFTLAGPSGWNGGNTAALDNFGSGTPFYGWFGSDPRAISGSYTLSATIDGVSYSSTFTVDAADVLPVVTNITPSGASTSGVSGTWTAAAGATIYRAIIQDIATGNELGTRVWTAATSATVTGATLAAATQYRLVINAFPLDPRDNTLGTTGTLPAKFNYSRNRNTFTTP